MQLPSRVSHSNSLNSFDTSSTDEDYIDMDVNSTTLLCYSITSSPEFEFNMSLKDKDSITSPADELFYKGKLLPLHLPPRIQMVQKLLQACNEEKKCSPLSSKEVTPFESCNVTPSESRHVSGELNPDECFYDCCMNSSVGRGVNDDGNTSAPSTKKVWCRRFQLVKQSSLGSKLKASRSYFRSLFRKQPVYSSDGSAKSKSEELLHTENSLKKFKELFKNKYLTMVGKREPCVQTSKESVKASVIEDTGDRKSSSDAVKTSSISRANYKSLSYPSLVSPEVDRSGFSGSHSLKRSSSVNSDVDRSVQGAIAYCKQSQLYSRGNLNEVGFFTLATASRVTACDTEERTGLCRGCLFRENCR